METRGRADRLAGHAVRLLALAGDPDLDQVLRRVVGSARTLVRARYAALGVPDGRGGFHRFLTVGIPEEQAARIGALPRRHGVLGELLEAGEAIRMDDIAEHPRFSGYPAHHPDMRDFLGVPIRHRGEVLGNLYLAGHRAGGFTEDDQQLVELLARYAGVAIANARLYAGSQEVLLLEERARVAQELHDSVSQTLFSMVFEARAGALRASDEESRAVLEDLERQASDALQEMRSLVQELRPKTLERDGLHGALVDHVLGLQRLHQTAIESHIEECGGLSLDQEHALFRIAQEALHNALRHAPGATLRVSARCEADSVLLEISDDGPGFDPKAIGHTERRMGLAGMRERAASVGGRFQLRTRPGRGCTVRIRVARSDRGERSA
ncbi:MAG TPA: GAF domain-containing sensor histidine kinase [Candidatus Dormibacteraeota bacterium]|jgi:signal transduction histidine kinase|nr:GAF domain-containing sensor histidine kinase [Candidatus Dormibacteraeota bacterium]